MYIYVSTCSNNTENTFLSLLTYIHVHRSIKKISVLLHCNLHGSKLFFQFQVLLQSTRERAKSKPSELANSSEGSSPLAAAECSA